MITLTITDSTDSMTFEIFDAPVILDPVIDETDVVAMTGNISTYYGSTKRQYEFDLSFLSAYDYARLVAFRDRQYSTLTYPTITVAGDDGLAVSDMVAKITVSRQEVVDECGVVQSVKVTFRETEQPS